jgi:hypothetical protein
MSTQTRLIDRAVRQLEHDRTMESIGEYCLMAALLLICVGLIGGMIWLAHVLGL